MVAEAATQEARPAVQPRPAIPEAREVLKTPKASDQLVAHLALGNFKKDAQPADIHKDVESKKPTEVHEDTYKALKARHDAQREADRDAFRKVLQQRYDTTPEAERDKIFSKSPEKMDETDLRDAQMQEWSINEAQKLSAEIGGFIKAGLHEEAEAYVDVMSKLGFSMDIHNLASIQVAPNIQLAMYDPNNHQEGDFYKQFCKGDTNKKLIGTLNVEEMYAARGFLERLLGSERAFDALVATKQAQERLKDTSKPLSPAAPGNQLKPEEHKILDFLAGAPVKKDDESKAKPADQQGQPKSSEGKDNEDSIPVRPVTADPNRTSIPIKPPEKKTGPGSQYTESLLAEKPTKDRPAPPMQILADQLNKAEAHFRGQGVTNNEDLAFKIAENFGQAGLYQRIVEQHMFGPRDFERSKDGASNIAAAERNKDRVIQLTEAAQQNGERVLGTDGWYHYFSPHIPQQRLETQYRLYLNPDTAKFPAVLESLLTYAKDNDLYFKTADPRDPGLFTRLDTIVVYLNEQNADKVTRFIQDQLFEGHKDAFQGRPAPGSSTVTIKPGIGLASQPARGVNGAEITAGQRNASKIEEALATFSLDELKRTIQRFPTETAFVNSPEYKLMKKAVSSVRYIGMPDAVTHSSETSELFADSLLQVAYRNAQGLTVTADSSNFPVIRLPMNDVLSTFKQKLQTKGLAQLVANIDALPPRQLNYQYESSCTLRKGQFTRAALAVNFHARLQNHQNLGEFFLGQYDRYAASTGKKPELTQPNLALRSIEKFPGGNEDHAFLHEGLQMGGMFDGMGGHAHGEEASRMARQLLSAQLADVSETATLDDIKQLMTRAMKNTNDQIARAFPDGGTTGSIFKIWTGPSGEKKVVVANVGDSRIWVRKRNGDIQPLTTDDNQVKSRYRARGITLNDYYRIQGHLDSITNEADLNQIVTLENGTQFDLKAAWRERNVITRSLGQQPFKMDPVQAFDIEAGDMIFYTSDGVHDNLSRNELIQIVKGAKTPQELAEKLTQEAYGVSQLSLSDDIRAKEDDITAGAMLVA